MSSYAGLVNEAAGARIALHYERKAHKNTRQTKNGIIKHLENQIEDKQALIETLLQRNVELEDQMWKLMDKCPVLNKHDKSQQEDEDDDDEDDEEDGDEEEDEDCPYKYSY